MSMLRLCLRELGTRSICGWDNQLGVCCAKLCVEAFRETEGCPSCSGSGRSLGSGVLPEAVGPARVGPARDGGANSRGWPKVGRWVRVGEGPAETPGYGFCSPGP